MDSFTASIPEIEKIIGYVFRDKSLITQAFTRTSFCNEHGGSLQSNEVLEFIGDSVLSVSIITFLMDEHTERYAHGIKTKFDEGDFSNIKSKLSDKKNLSECITSLGLEKYLRMGEGDKKLGIEREPSVKEDLFESIIGATYIDCGRNIETVMGVVSRMLDVSLYAVKNPPLQSSKNALQEFCADKKRKLPAPVYKTLSEDGPDHKKTYERGAFIGDRLVARGIGKNMKIADSNAAEAALKILIAEEKADANTADGKPEKQKAPEPSTTAKAQKKKAAGGKPAPENTEPKAEGRKKDKKKPEKLLKATPSKASNSKKQTNVDKSTVAGESGNENSKRTKKATRGDTSTTKKPVANGKKASAPSSVKAKSAPTEKGKPKTLKSASPDSSASLSLKKRAVSGGVATPTYKDLGEVKVGKKSEYRVECIFMGASEIGSGSTRPEAKENAALIMLNRLRLSEKKATKTPSRDTAPQPKRNSKRKKRT